MNLSANFSLNELTKSQTATRLGIENLPNAEQFENLKVLVDGFLQPLRTLINRPINVSSCFRGELLSDATPNSNRLSQHCKGEAVDFEVMGFSNFHLAETIIEYLPFDQLILEYFVKGIPASGWVHCSYKNEGNRNEILTAARNPETGKTEYFNGLNVTPYG